MSSFARAKEHFYKGIQEQNAEHWERALALFRQSREEAPTWQSTMNAALCLTKLGRYDGALTMYEGLLTSFAAQLNPADRISVDAAISSLTQKVAILEITSGAAALVLVDGLPRGELPENGSLVIHVSADTHRVEIVKAGFKPFHRERVFRAGSTIIFEAELAKAPAPPPRPRQPAQPYSTVSVFTGAVLAGSLGSTAERGTSATRDAPAAGFFGGIRGGYTFSIGLSLEVDAGYLAAVSVFHRNVEQPLFIDRNPTVPIPLTFDLKDTLRMSGPFFGLGASYRMPLDDRLSVLFRTTFGVFQARSVDPVSGAVCAEAGCVPSAKVTVRGSGQILTSTSGFFLPEVGLEASWGGLHVGASLGIFLLTAAGPSFIDRQTTVNRARCTSSAVEGFVGCAPNRSLGVVDPNDAVNHGQHELAYGQLALIWVPQIVVGYSF